MNVAHAHDAHDAHAHAHAHAHDAHDDAHDVSRLLPAHTTGHTQENIPRGSTFVLVNPSLKKLPLVANER